MSGRPFHASPALSRLPEMVNGSGGAGKGTLADMRLTLAPQMGKGLEVSSAVRMRGPGGWALNPGLVEVLPAYELVGVSLSASKAAPQTHPWECPHGGGAHSPQGRRLLLRGRKASL